MKDTTSPASAPRRVPNASPTGRGIRPSSAGAASRGARPALVAVLATILAAIVVAAAAQSALRGTLAASGADGAPAGTVTYTARDAVQQWSGAAPIDELEMAVDPNDLSGARVRVLVRSGGFDSGIFLRDANARRIVFESADHPTIEFVATSLRAEPTTLPPGATRRIELTGRLSMHGVVRTVETSATVARDGDRLHVTGELSVLLSDYGMRRPSFLTLRVDDEVVVGYDLRVQLEGGAP